MSLKKGKCRKIVYNCKINHTFYTFTHYSASSLWIHLKLFFVNISLKTLTHKFLYRFLLYIHIAKHFSIQRRQQQHVTLFFPLYSTNITHFNGSKYLHYTAFPAIDLSAGTSCRALQILIFNRCCCCFWFSSTAN